MMSGGGRRAALAGGVLATLLAGALLGWRLSEPAGPRAEAAPPPTTSVALTPLPTTSAPAPARPATPHDRVPRAVPTSFTLSGPRFTIRAHVCSMADIRPYDPPGEQHHTICWVRNGFGTKPGSAAATSYLFGHSWAEDAQEVLNRASAPATRELLAAHPVRLDGVPVRPVHVLDGYRLTLRTSAGTLTYTVRQVYGVRKLLLGGISSWEDEHVPNRVVLTTCAERNGVDYDYNIVIVAYLTSSRRS
jgi:hypothetical protein